MKVVHLILSCFYKEGYGYQENILPYKHKQLGFDTTIVTRFATENVLPIMESGNRGISHYINKNGVDVYILPTNNNLLRKFPFISRIINHTVKLYQVLDELSPDVIFCHGVFISDYRIVIKYKKKNPHIKIFVDNHSDYYNTPVKKNFLATLYRKHFQIPLIKSLENNSEMFWGVTPWRVDYLREVFGVSVEKSNLLVMGGDEDLVNWSSRDYIRREVRSKYRIKESDFLIVSGGKMDESKNTHILIDSIKELDNVKLLLFGSINSTIEKLVKDVENVIYIGWQKSEDVYDIFLSADLGVFPGTHSVLWEQACASGLPCIFKDWDGHMNHVDIGGNCVLIKNIDIDSLKSNILHLIKNSDDLSKMKNIAQTGAREYFSYKQIAKRSILLQR